MPIAFLGRGRDGASLLRPSTNFEIGYPQTAYDATGTNVISSEFTTEKDVGEWAGAELQLNKRLWDPATSSRSALSIGTIFVRSNASPGEHRLSMTGKVTGLCSRRFCRVDQSSFQRRCALRPIR